MIINIGKILLLLCSVFAFSCLSDPVSNPGPKSGAKSSSNAEFKISLDSSISSPFVQGAWLAYTSVILEDMKQFYAENKENDYIIPYNIEVKARNSMADFYLRVQKEYKINDPYIEDLIKIRTLKKINEYIFFSFNPGNWVNEKNYNETEFKNWINTNMPEHKPVTLAHVKKINNQN